MAPRPFRRRVRRIGRHNNTMQRWITEGELDEDLRFNCQEEFNSSGRLTSDQTQTSEQTRKSTKKPTALVGKSPNRMHTGGYISTNNRLLSAQLKKRLEEIRKVAALFGDDPTVKVNSSAISEYFICPMCKGYFFNATTITECLHTFCKACVVKHLTLNLNCPKCNILVHPTDPFVNLRRDSTIQDLLYKVLPGVEREERSRERKFREEMDQKGLFSSSQETKDLDMSTSHDEAKKGFRENSQREDNTGSNELVYIGFELNLIGCCEIMSVQPPNKTYFCFPTTSTVKEVQSFLESKLNVPPSSQVSLFIEGYLINPLLTVGTLWGVFSDGDIHESLLVLSYAIMPCKDYFNEVNSNS